MQYFKFKKLPRKVLKKGNFDKNCQLSLGDETLVSIKSGKLRLRFFQYGNNIQIKNFNVSIQSVSGNITIFVGDDDAKVTFEPKTSGHYELRLWQKSQVTIGKSTTSNGIKIVCFNSEFICGEDCMFSDDILVQSSDQHPIVDLHSGEIINGDYKSVVLGNHVWIGRKSTLTANAKVGDGSVIGTCSLVTCSIPEKVIAVGNPARIIKENHTWSRYFTSLDRFSKQYIAENKYLCP